MQSVCWMPRSVRCGMHCCSSVCRRARSEVWLLRACLHIQVVVVALCVCVVLFFGVEFGPGLLPQCNVVVETAPLRAPVCL